MNFKCPGTDLSFPVFVFSGGCAFYGHSCFGGHGKRSMPNVNMNPYPRPLPIKFVQDPMHLEVPGSYDNNVEENSYSDESPEQDFKYAVYGLFKQWVIIIC